MAKRFKLFSALLLCFLVSTVAEAGVRPKIMAQVTKAKESAEAGLISEALNSMSALTRDIELNADEVDLVLETSGYFYYQQGNYIKALSNYEAVYESSRRSKSQKIRLLPNLTMLSYHSDQFKKTISYAQLWKESTAKKTISYYVLVAQAYLQLNQPKNAVGFIQSAIQIAERDKGKAPETYYLIAASAAYELNDYKYAVKIFKKLVEFYFKEEYLTQMAGLYGYLGDDKRQMAILDALYLYNQARPENEIVTLASMHIATDYPLRAAEIMDNALKRGHIKKTSRNLQIMGSAYSLALENDKAIDAFKRAAKLSEDDAVFMQLARLFYEEERYEEASQYGELGLKVKVKNNYDNILKVLAAVEIDQGNYDRAGQYYLRLKKPDEKVRAFLSTL